MRNECAGSRASSYTLFAFLTAIALAGCGGGGGGSGGGGGGSTTPPIPAPSSLAYSAPPAFTVGQAIAPLTPTVTGQVASYTVNPALPAGLTLSSSTGVISGTPTTITATTPYAVTASNVTGSIATSVSITVNDVPPTLGYPSPSYSFTANVAAQTVTPTAGGGTVTGWSISPALPAGLSFDTKSGNISGTPTAAAASAVYVVTATNSGGSATATLTVAVAAAPLLDLGHATEVKVVRANGGDVLSLDIHAHWILQNYSSGNTLASGDVPCDGTPCTALAPTVLNFTPVDLAGSVMMDAVSGGVEVRSATDGHLLTTLAGSFAWYRLASDGSYICAGSTTSITAWSPSGQTLFTEKGDYSQANVFAAPSQVLVALGAGGPTLIESISVATGSSSLSPAFQGTFAVWFADGSRFLTNQGNVVWTYSDAAVQQDVTQVSSMVTLGGQGNWLWTYANGGSVNIYQVGASAAPAFSQNYGIESLPVSSGSTLSVLAFGAGQLTNIDLSGTTPVATSYSVPLAYLSAFTTIPGGAWIVANEHGVLFDGATVAASQPRYLTLGSAWSITGGADYFSIATASGQIFSYDAATNALVSTLNFSSSLLAASATGTILAATADALDAQYSPSRTLNVYSLPSGNILNTLTYVPSINPLTISLSADGTVLEAPLENTSGCSVEALDLTNSAVLWCGTATGYGAVQLSPDGTLIAASSQGLPSPSTSLYKNGVLVGAIPGLPVGWLDNSRLLVNNYVVNNNVPGAATYTGATIYDSLGNPGSTLSLPELSVIEPLTANALYAPRTNAIMSLTNGATTWASGDASLDIGIGTVAGTQVIFASGTSVLAQPY
jgi:hypothetical protein